MARIPFTDTHVHFHDTRDPTLFYDWNVPDTPAPPLFGDQFNAIRTARYWADDWLMESRFHNVERVIHMECARGIKDPVDETKWLQAFTDRVGVPHGAIVQAFVARPDFRQMLERHTEYPIVRGIRDPDAGAFLSDEWRKGYPLLEEFDLVCCSITGYQHMPAARRLIEEHPGITYCVEHTGSPTARDDDYFQKWKQGIHEIARAPSAVIKLSGLAMRDPQWTIDSIRPWILESIEAFGPDRCFFGSNWTIDKLFSTYGDVIDAYAEIISDFSEAQQRAMFSENAKRIFRVN